MLSYYTPNNFENDFTGQKANTANYPTLLRWNHKNKYHGKQKIILRQIIYFLIIFQKFDVTSEKNCIVVQNIFEKCYFKSSCCI